MQGDYSRRAFEAARDDPEQLVALSRQLADEITDRLRPTLIQLTQAIVDELNAAGHHLTLYLEPTGGEITYRDRGTDEQPAAGLRVAHDSIVSVGYGDFDPT
jgi:hypothetical protein